jgi:hypothetical protein
MDFSTNGEGSVSRVAFPSTFLLFLLLLGFLFLHLAPVKSANAAFTPSRAKPSVVDREPAPTSSAALEAGSLETSATTPEPDSVTALSASLRASSLETATRPAELKASDTLPAPPGMLVHEVKRGESMGTLVHLYLPKTQYMTGTELQAAIRASNPGLSNSLKLGTNVFIPGYEAEWREQPQPMPKDFEVRAIYLTGTMAGSARGLDLVRRWRALGGNAVVFDVKDSDGLLNVPFEHPLLHASAQFKAKSPMAGRVTPPLRNLPKYVRWLHGQNLHAIARIAIFRDEYLVTHHPELAVRSRQSGAPWRENGKLVWTDPSNPEVQAYDIALARNAAESGVDEVQFDYVRFPAEGDQKDALFAYQKLHSEMQRSDVIVDFLRQAHEALQSLDVLLSLDVFGVMAWERPVDLAHTGQDIARMAMHCDVLSPMIYPSHFFGMDGYKLPGDAPEHFIGESMARFQEVTKGSGVTLRPWLQAFAWRTRTYSPDYILKQVATARENGGNGFLFWNARNDYAKPITAMPEMRAVPGRYFRGDELPQKSSKLLQASKSTAD